MKEKGNKKPSGVSHSDDKGEILLGDDLRHSCKAALDPGDDTYTAAANEPATFCDVFSDIDHDSDTRQVQYVVFCWIDM
jgi:hypothetical protein